MSFAALTQDAGATAVGPVLLVLQLVATKLGPAAAAVVQPLVGVGPVTRLAQLVVVKSLLFLGADGTQTACWGVGPVLLEPQTVLRKFGLVPVTGVHEATPAGTVLTVAQVREKYPLPTSGD